MSFHSDEYDTIKKDFPKILSDQFANVTLACKSAGIHRDTFYRWYKEDEEFAKQCDVAKEVRKDFVENKLVQRINNDDTTSIIFFLKTQAKDRGYVERIEQTGKDGGAIKQETEVTLRSEDDQQIVENFKNKIKQQMEANGQGTSSIPTI